MVHFLLIRAASLMVPALWRAEWRREWDAELWHVSLALEERQERAAHWKLWRFCCGAFADAIWHLRNLFDHEALQRAVQRRTESASFCLACLAALMLLIVFCSGLLPRTRDLVMPLPYENAGRIVTVSRNNAALAMREEVPFAWLHLWRNGGRLTEGAAAYRWSRQVLTDSAGQPSRVVAAQVSDNFFPLLGPQLSAGRMLLPGDARRCPDCIVLSHAFAREHDLAVGSRVSLAGAPRRVIGILDRRFWFLSREVAVWSVGIPKREATGVGVIVRLRPDIALNAAEGELESAVQASGIAPWNSIVGLTVLQDRVRSVFGSFALGASLALIIALVGLRVRMPDPAQCRAALSVKRAWLRVLFFAARPILLLSAVLLAGIEFTHAPAITMIGGTDALTEPFSTWMFLLASMAAFAWSIHDHRRRCRVCHRRLGLAAHVGCRGCMLLDWSGTEMVCIHGHGILHIPEMLSSVQETERWTSLDESWQGLFAR
jgi:hypothetical protein